jgi:hypothetical protein
MTTKETSPAKRRNPPPITRDEQPLLRALVFEATRRGDTLAALAKELGVTYERLAQWRRNDALIATAHRSVHERAATYLGLPTMLILLMAGFAGLNDFVWPCKDPLIDRIGRELERMRQDPCIGPFVPKELAAASPSVKLFAAFMFHELHEDGASRKSSSRWLHALHQAATGNVEGQLELEVLRKQSHDSPSIF